MVCVVALNGILVLLGRVHCEDASSVAGTIGNVLSELLLFYHDFG